MKTIQNDTTVGIAELILNASETEVNGFYLPSLLLFAKDLTGAIEFIHHTKILLQRKRLEYQGTCPECSNNNIF